MLLFICRMQVFVRRLAPVGSSQAFVLVVFIAALVIACSKSGSATSDQATGLASASQAHWLYVLDTKRKAGEGQILALSADTGEVVRAVPTGLSPDFILSPNGDRAYVVSRPKTSMHNTLAVVDLPAGDILDSQVVLDRADYTTPVPPRAVAVSLDGRWVYILKLHWTSADEQAGIGQKDEYSIAVYDTRRRTFVNSVPLAGDCYGNYLLPSPGALNVLCSGANDVTVFPSTSSGLDSRPRSVSLPSPPRLVLDSFTPTTAETTPIHPALVGGVISGDGLLLTLVTSYMRLIQIDTPTSKVVKQKQVRDDRWAMPGTVVSSPDGNQLYVAVGPISRRNRAPGVDEILVFDMRTLAQLATIPTSGVFQSLSISRDGRWLYAVSPDTSSIHVIDVSQNRESRTLTGIGVSPVRLESGP